MSHGQKSESEALDELLRRVRGDEARKGLVSGLPELTREPGDASDEGLQDEIVRSLKLRVRLKLGRTTLPLSEALALESGAVVELGREVGEAVDLVVNDVPIARGEVLVVDERFCVRITELLTNPPEAEP